MSHEEPKNKLTPPAADQADHLHEGLQSDHSATGSDEMQTELRFDDAVIQKIAGITAAHVEGLLRLEGGMFHDMTDFLRKGDDPKAGVAVNVDDQQRVKIELDATMHYGEDAPQVFKETVAEIAKNVKAMTGMDVTAVKMTVKDMLTDEELEAERAKQSKTEAASDEDRDMQPA